MGDYHTDVNIQMNYWMADPPGYRAASMPSPTIVWPNCRLGPTPPCDSSTTRAIASGTSSGKVGGWTVGISTNIDGGSGWQWHPAGSAWLANTLFEHYEYSQDTEMLARIYPW